MGLVIAIIGFFIEQGDVLIKLFLKSDEIEKKKLEKKETLNENEFVIMEVKVINDELVVDEIYDDKVAEEVTLLFKKKFQEQ